MNRRFLVLSGLAIVTLILFIVGTSMSSDRGIGTGKEYSPPNGPATMAASEELYRKLSNNIRFTALREDLAFFGRTTIADYRSGKFAEVVFAISSEISQNNNTLTFSGKFEKSKDKITVVIDPLKFERMKVSITNNKTKVNIDNELPSNSKENQFIASLPIDGDGYRIGYISEEKSYEINILRRESALVEIANKKLVESLGIGDIQQIPVQYTYPTPSFDE